MMTMTMIQVRVCWWFNDWANWRERRREYIYKRNKSTQKSPKKWVMCDLDAAEAAAETSLGWCSEREKSGNASRILLFRLQELIKREGKADQYFVTMTMKTETPGLVSRVKNEKKFGKFSVQYSGLFITLSRGTLHIDYGWVTIFVYVLAF